MGHGRAVGRDGADRRLLVLPHEAAVALHIRAQDGREPALEDPVCSWDRPSE